MAGPWSTDNSSGRGRLGQPLAKSWTTLKAATSTFLGEFLGRPQEFPLTRFNSEVSPHRVFETARDAIAAKEAGDRRYLVRFERELAERFA